MAISKQRKHELVELYKKWLNESDALVITQYHGLTVSDISKLRAGIRETDGEFHVVKNTLVKMALDDAEREWAEEYFTGPTAVGVSFGNPTGLAKAIKDFAKESNALEIKGGYLADRMMSVAEINALANLPTMDEMRAKLLQTILAPASQLVRTLAEPGRQVAAVLKAYSEEAPATEAA
ncbi:MAG: 50S ribosomal protein L10 [Chloroflexota bacterium]|nr:MAG: 50S ribosomal protein L10 [Chloroflexota bacterium]